MNAEQLIELATTMVQNYQLPVTALIKFREEIIKNINKPQMVKEGVIEISTNLSNYLSDTTKKQDFAYLISKFSEYMNSDVNIDKKVIIEKIKGLGVEANFIASNKITEKLLKAKFAGVNAARNEDEEDSEEQKESEDAVEKIKVPNYSSFETNKTNQIVAEKGNDQIFPTLSNTVDLSVTSNAQHNIDNVGTEHPKAIPLPFSSTDLQEVKLKPKDKITKNNIEETTLPILYEMLIINYNNSDLKEKYSDFYRAIENVLQNHHEELVNNAIKNKELSSNKTLTTAEIKQTRASLDPVKITINSIISNSVLTNIEEKFYKNAPSENKSELKKKRQEQKLREALGKVDNKFLIQIMKIAQQFKSANEPSINSPLKVTTDEKAKLEQAKAEQERARAEQQAREAEQERARAAELERAKAEQELARAAEQKRAKAEQQAREVEEKATKQAKPVADKAVPLNNEINHNMAQEENSIQQNSEYSINPHLIIEDDNPVDVHIYNIINQLKGINKNPNGDAKINTISRLKLAKELAVSLNQIRTNNDFETKSQRGKYETISLMIKEALSKGNRIPHTHGQQTEIGNILRSAKKLTAELIQQEIDNNNPVFFKQSLDINVTTNETQITLAEKQERARAEQERAKASEKAAATETARLAAEKALTEKTAAIVDIEKKSEIVSESIENVASQVDLANETVEPAKGATQKANPPQNTNNGLKGLQELQNKFRHNLENKTIIDGDNSDLPPPPPNYINSVQTNTGNTPKKEQINSATRSEFDGISQKDEEILQPVLENKGILSEIPKWIEVHAGGDTEISDLLMKYLEQIKLMNNMEILEEIIKEMEVEDKYSKSRSALLMKYTELKDINTRQYVNKEVSEDNETNIFEALVTAGDVISTDLKKTIIKLEGYSNEISGKISKKTSENDPQMRKLNLARELIKSLRLYRNEKDHRDHQSQRIIEILTGGIQSNNNIKSMFLLGDKLDGILKSSLHTAVNAKLSQQILTEKKKMEMEQPIDQLVAKAAQAMVNSNTPSNPSSNKPSSEVKPPLTFSTSSNKTGRNSNEKEILRPATQKSSASLTTDTPVIFSNPTNNGNMHSPQPKKTASDKLLLINEMFKDLTAYKEAIDNEVNDERTSITHKARKIFGGSLLADKKEKSKIVGLLIANILNVYNTKETNSDVNKEILALIESAIKDNKKAHHFMLGGNITGTNRLNGILDSLQKSVPNLIIEGNKASPKSSTDNH